MTTKTIIPYFNEFHAAVLSKKFLINNFFPLSVQLGFISSVSVTWFVFNATDTQSQALISYYFFFNHAVFALKTRNTVILFQFNSFHNNQARYQRKGKEIQIKNDLNNFNDWSRLSYFAGKDIEDMKHILRETSVQRKELMFDFSVYFFIFQKWGTLLLSASSDTWKISFLFLPFPFSFLIFFCLSFII